MGHGHGSHCEHGYETVLSKQILLKLVLIVVISVVLQLIGNAGFAGTVSLLSDALHSVFDGVAYVSALCALMIASWASDSPRWVNRIRHRWQWVNKALSHNKDDIVHMGNLIAAALLPVAGCYVMWEAITHLNNAEHHELQVFHALLFGSIGLFANIFMRRLLKGELNKVTPGSEEAKTLKITYLHVKADLYHSLIVLIGLIIILLFGKQWTWIDPMLSLWLATKLIKWGKDWIRELTAGRTYRIPSGVQLVFPPFHEKEHGHPAHGDHESFSCVE